VKPTFIAGPGLFVPADVAEVIGPVLKRELARAIRGHERASEDVVETIERLVLVGEAWANRVAKVAEEVADLDPPRCDPFESISVKQSSDELAVSEAAVKGLIKRKTLHAVKAGRSWRVCVADVEARKVNARCPH
jgi:hypothetical protein